MKKSLIALSTAGLLLSGVFPVVNVYADGIETVNVQDEVLDLTLESLIDRAIGDDSNLLILKHQLDILDKKEKDAEDKIEDTDDSIEDLKGIPGARGPLYDARENLLKQLEQLEYQKNLSGIQLESTKEAVQTFVTSRYIQLLTLEEQLELSKQSLTWLEQDLQVLNLKREVGLVSQYEIRDLERQIEDLTRTIEDTQATYDNELLKLLVDLNIPYSEDITLADIEGIEVELTENPADVVGLIADSYQMQSAQENIKIAELNLEQNWYSGRFGRQTYQIQIDIAKEEAANLDSELENKIHTLYDETKTLFLSYQDALRNLANLEEDQERMELQYELGLVSQYDFDKVDRSLQQAQLDVQLTELNYFLKLQQIEALQRGYIQ